MMRRRHRVCTAPLRHREQAPIPLAARRLFDPDPGMNLGRSSRDRNDLQLHAERFSKACGLHRFFSGRCPQPVVDVNEYRLDTKGCLNPSQRGGERQRVTTAGESDDDPIMGHESHGARARQQALLEPVRRLPAGSAMRSSRKRRAAGSIVAFVVDRGIHLVPTGGIEPPAKGL